MSFHCHFINHLLESLYKWLCKACMHFYCPYNFFNRKIIVLLFLLAVLYHFERWILCFCVFHWESSIATKCWLKCTYKISKLIHGWFTCKMFLYTCCERLLNALVHTAYQAWTCLSIIDLLCIQGKTEQQIKISKMVNFSLLFCLSSALRVVVRTLIWGGAYSCIHVLPDKSPFKLNSSCSIWK